MRGFWNKPNTDSDTANQNDWSKDSWKKCSIKVIQAAMWVRFSDSESACVVCPTHWTLYPPNKHLTCFTTFHLCGNSFLQNQEARALSLTTGLVTRI